MSTTEGKKLLIVDDESDITFTIKSILEDNGFKVDSFTDSISALDNYQINFYDLVILDIKMPKMDGFKLYTKIKEKDPKVKICFLTASELYYEEFRKTRSELAKTIGEDCFIQKPINAKDLIKYLTRIMNNKNKDNGGNRMLSSNK
ncbi:MAG: response regulator [Deltaproteobacteria bacterium]